VSYGAVDRDGDGYYVAESGTTCLLSAMLPQTKQSSSVPAPTFAAAVPKGKSESSSASDRDPVDPIGAFSVVGPSERGSGFWNGYEGLEYEYFSPGVGFHYLNTIRAESAWMPDFSSHGLRVASAVGGSQQLSYSVQILAPDPTMAAGGFENVQVDAGGRVVIACGMAPGTEFELRVRDVRTGVEHRNRFFSAGDGPACIPDPNSTPTPSVTNEPGPTGMPTNEPVPTGMPTNEPVPTETSNLEPMETPTPTEDNKCPSERDSGVEFDSVPANTKVTKYGYDGDPYSDTASAAGVSSCTAHADLDGNGVKDLVDFLNQVLQPRGDQQAIADWLKGVLNENYAPASHFLKPGDIALSPDLSGRFKCGEVIEVKVETGSDTSGKPTFECFTGRVWDKTADYLSGRVDVYAPSGSHELDGRVVTGIRTVR
jgi:hypothetical protein